MKNLFKALFFLSTCLPLFAAAPYEYSPVFTNLVLISTPGLANRVTSLVGGGVVTNLYTGSLNGLAGTFIWNPAGEISSWDGIDVLDKRIASPVNATHTAGAGTLATATYYYRVSALTALGETVASTETSLALTGPAGINVNWVGVPGATGYKVYGRATGAELFIAQVGQVATYLDTGAITPSGAMPATNSTMGVIGTWNRHFIKVFGKSPQSGDLTNDFPNLSLVPVGTAAGPIGSATTSAVVTTDSKGRVTALTSVAISGVAPGGAAGGGLSGTYPNPNVNLSATTSILGDLPLSNIVQIANNTILGNFTGGAADIQVLTSITSANLAQILSNETGTLLAVFSDSPTFTTQITTPSAIVSSLTPTRVVFVGGSDELVDSANLTFTGGNLLSVAGSQTISSKLTVGSSSLQPNMGIYMTGAVPAAGSTAAGLQVDAALGSGATAYGVAGYFNLATEAAAFTMGTGWGVYIGTPIKGAGSTITSAYGLYVDTQNKGGTDNYGVYITGASGGSGSNFGLYNGGTSQLQGNVGIGTATGLAKLSVNGGVHIGGDSDPGDNNLTVDGLTTTATLTVSTTHTASYATASTVAVFNASKELVSSGVTTSLLDGFDARISARVREPKYGTVDPNFGTPVVGDDDGQMYVNTATGERWWYYEPGVVWLP